MKAINVFVQAGLKSSEQHQAGMIWPLLVIALALMATFGIMWQKQSVKDETAMQAIGFSSE